MLRMLSAPDPREVKPKRLQLVENADYVLGLEFANLQIGAGGDICVAQIPSLQPLPPSHASGGR